MNATIRTPNKGRTVAVVGDVYRFLATGADTNGTYALWEALVPPGGGPPPHVHSREEEGFYVLEGEITFTINGEKVVATAGTFANMPVGTPHSFRNESDRPAKMLPGYAAYVATKGAVEQLSHVLAKELGPKGITVNVVSPGPTDTELFGQGKTEEQKQAFAKMAALGRLGTPEDIAATVAMLVGPDAGWVTGQNVRVNGGLI